MPGLTTERIPKGGAFALSMVGGVDTIIAGLVTAPLMGGVGFSKKLQLVAQAKNN